MPAHNHALRRKAESGVLELDDEPGVPRFIPAVAVEAGELAGRYGPFTSKRAAREALRHLAREHALCWSALGLERRAGPCFARQVRRCAGACVGAETMEAHHARLREALAPLAVPPWPFPGLAAIRERALLGERTDVHVLRDWCWLGTARDEGELGCDDGRAAATRVRRRHREAPDPDPRARPARGAAARMSGTPARAGRSQGAKLASASAGGGRPSWRNDQTRWGGGRSEAQRLLVTRNVRKPRYEPMLVNIERVASR